MARLEMTSLAFMFDCVPEPGLEDDQREVVVELAGDDLVAGLRDVVRRSPSSALARAADFFRIPRARTIGRPANVLRPMSKLCGERAFGLGAQ